MIQASAFSFKTGVISDEEWNKRNEERLAREHKQELYELLKKSGCPERHLDSCLENNGESGEWSSKYKQLLRQLGKGMLIALVGKRGCGKTQMAVELIKANCKLSEPSLYVKCLEIFMDIRATFDGNKDERKALNRFISPYLLVIDEAHERGESAWEDRMLTYLIDKRYDAMKDTILISNMTKEDFLKSVGSSVSSRLNETGGVIVCDWKSFRG